MSETLATAVQWVRELTNTAQMSRPPIDDQALRRIIISMSVMKGASYRLGEAWDDSAITLAAGTSDYVVSGEIANVLSFKLGSQGYIIPVVPTDLLENRWRRGAAADYSQGDPQDCYILETSAQAFTVRFGPQPNKADTVAVLYSTLPANTLTDATVIPLATDAQHSLHYDVASLVLRRMTPEQLAEIKINPDAAMRYEMEAEKARIRAVERRNKQKLTIIASPWAS